MAPGAGPRSFRSVRRHPRLILALALASLPAALFACPPWLLARTAAALFPGCLYDVPPAGGGAAKVLALTIDDAPDPATTPALLDTLRRYGARTTFFVITGQLAAAGADSVLLGRLVRDGHEVGNHGTRDRAAVRLDSAAFAADLRAADSALGRWLPTPASAPRWARPGSGWYSGRMVREMERAGYRCALGSVYPLDAALGWPWLSERYILAHARPGAVIILHDRGTRGRRTAQVLGRVLPALRARGYEVVTLGQLAARTAGAARAEIRR